MRIYRAILYACVILLSLIYCANALYVNGTVNVFEYNGSGGRVGQHRSNFSYDDGIVTGDEIEFAWLNRVHENPGMLVGEELCRGRICRVYQDVDGNKTWVDKRYNFLVVAEGIDNRVLRVDGISERRGYWMPSRMSVYDRYNKYRKVIELAE